MSARSLVLRIGAGALVAVLAVLAVVDARGADGDGGATSRLTLIAPAAVGGGWDLVAREAQQALRSDGVVNSVSVVNIPGAGGSIGLSQIAGLEGDAQTLMVTGTVMLGAIAGSGGQVTLEDTTPIARIAEDFEVIAVPASSPIETFDDLVRVWREDPAALPIGGGSAGGVDHLVAAQLARSLDFASSDLYYTAHSGGGELTQSLTSSAAGTVEVGISSYNDFRDLIDAGQLRGIAVVAPEPLPGVDIPTMIELGHPEVDLVNWRGFVAPAGITEDQRAELTGIVEQLVQTESWTEAVEINRWVPNLATGTEFEDFIDEEQDRIDTLMEELDLA